MNTSIDNYKSYSQEFENLVKEHNKLSELAEKIIGKQALTDNLQACMKHFFNSLYHI